MMTTIQTSDQSTNHSNNQSTQTAHSPVESEQAQSGFWRWFRLSLKLLSRDWRSGELNILILALVVAVAGTSMVNIFADRIGRTLSSQAAELMGGDVVLGTSKAYDQKAEQHAQNNNMNFSKAIFFRSMVTANDEFFLVSVKAVDEAFPLKGKLKVMDQMFGEVEERQEGPGPGQTWIEGRVAQTLGISVGDNLGLGETEVRVDKILSFENDAGRSFYVGAPRILVNIADMEKANIIQPGSRVRFGYYYTGSEQQIENVLADIKADPEPDHRVQTVQDSEGAINNALTKANQYLSLASLIAVALAGVAIAMASRRYSERHLNPSALMRVMGAKQNQILGLYVSQLVILSLFATFIGLIVGYIAHLGLLGIMKEIVAVDLQAAGLKPYLLSLSIGVLALIGFSLPPLLRLRNVSTLSVLRKEPMAMPINGWLVYGFAFLAMFGMAVQYTSDVKLSLIVVIGGALMVVVLGVIVYALIKTVFGRFNWFKGSTRNAIRNLYRYQKLTLSQTLGFGVAFMAMATILIIRTELLSNWQNQLPEDAPNNFVLNVLPQDEQGFAAFLKDNEIQSSYLYPVIRGRLTQINERLVQEGATKEEEREKRDEALRRDLNLTYASEMNPDNKLLKGEWWTEEDIGKPLVSVEEQLSRRLGIGIGDTIGITVGAQEFQATVKSIRSVKWDSFNPNFYFIFPPKSMEDFPKTFLTSFHLPSDKNDLLRDMVKQFPSVSVISVEQILAQVRSILQQVTMAIEYILMFVLLAGITVLFASLKNTLDERIYQGALLRAFGGSKQYLKNSLLIEFVCLGLLSGLVAIAGAEGISYLLYTRIFQIEYTPALELWLTLPLASILIICVAGIWSTRQVTKTSPMILLREF